MKLSLNWLKQYVDHGLTPESLQERLTMAGLEVESVSTFGGDTVFEIEVTPNRPDCLNIIGLAREVSAITDKELKIPAPHEHEDSGDVDISIEDAQACGRYIGTVIDGIAIKSFPPDKSILLQALGAKPISGIVDLTNFCLFELGQPLHAFDYDKLEGGKIIVRRARKGETIITLDDVERKLDESILVIADARKPVAIAGIMGGRDTGVTSSTKRVLLESAFFDLGVVRRGSRKLGLTSDAAYRFERGVAWKTVETASNRATDMILDIAGGKVVARKDVVAKKPEAERQEITVSAADIQSLLGAPIEITAAEKILKRLGCIVSGRRQALSVVAPHYRNDLKIKEDLIEEVARIVGFDNLPMSLPRIQATNIPVSLEDEKFLPKIEKLLVGMGLHQTVTFSMVSAQQLQKCQYPGEVIKLQNPMSADQEIMRPTFVPSMLDVVLANMNRGQRDLKLFEVGKKYLKGGEKWTLAIVLAGRRSSDWRAKKESIVFADLKGIVESLLTRLNINGYVFEQGEHFALEDGQTAKVLVGGKSVGTLGPLKDNIVKAWDIKKGTIYFAGLDLESIKPAISEKGKYEPLDEYPPSVRDISVAVRDVPFEAIKKTCESEGTGLLRKIEFIEEYVGEKVESGYKGLVFSLTYQSKERTLKDDEVNALHERIVSKLIEKFGVKRR